MLITMQQVIFILFFLMFSISCGDGKPTVEVEGEEHLEDEDGLLEGEGLEEEGLEECEEGDEECIEDREREALSEEENLENAEIVWNESEQGSGVPGYYTLTQSTIDTLNQVNCTPDAKFVARYSSLRNYAGRTHSASIVKCTRGQENRYYLLREYPHMPGGSHLLCDLCRKIVLPQQQAQKDQIAFEMVSYAVNENKYCSSRTNEYINEDMMRGYQCEWYVTPRDMQVAQQTGVAPLQPGSLGPARGGAQGGVPQLRGGQQMGQQPPTNPRQQGREPHVILQRQDQSGGGEEGRRQRRRGGGQERHTRRQ